MPINNEGNKVQDLGDFESDFKWSDQGSVDNTESLFAGGMLMKGMMEPEEY